MCEHIQQCVELYAIQVTLISLSLKKEQSRFFLDYPISQVMSGQNNGKL